MRFYFLICLLFLPSISFPAALEKTSTVSFNAVNISDLARVVYGDLLAQSYVFDTDLIHSEIDVSINWVKFPLSKIRSLTDKFFIDRGYDLEMVEKVLHIRKIKKQDDDFLFYIARFRGTKYLSDIVQKITGDAQMGARALPASGSFAAPSAPGQKEVTGSAAAQVDKSAPDQLVYNCLPAACTRIKGLLVQLDTPEPQIVLRAAIYEVGTSHNEGSALKIASTLLGAPFSVAAGSDIAGNASIKLTSATFDAALSLLDQDARFNSISRPMLRVKTGGTAKFSVGQNVPILGAVSYDKFGTPVQSIEYKQSGTIFSVIPDVRADVVDLSLTQELSSFVATTTGVNNSPTLLQRSVTSQLSIKPGEVIIFAGLEDLKEDGAESKLWGFNLGKKSSRSKSEVLVFIEAQRI